MAQFVVGVVFEPDRRRGRPLCVLFCDSHLGDAVQFQFLATPQLRDQWPVPIWISYHGVSEDLISSITSRDNKVTCKNHHGTWARAFRVKRQCDRAKLTVGVAVFAVAGVGEEGGAVEAVERDEAEAVGDELIGQDGGVGYDVDEVDGEGWDLGEHGAAERVGEGKGGGLQDEFDAVLFGLGDYPSVMIRREQTWLGRRELEKKYAVKAKLTSRTTTLGPDVSMSMLSSA